MKGACKNNLMNKSVIYYQNTSVVSGKVMELRIVFWLIEKLIKIRDKKGIFAAVLTDLSKGFDCIPDNLLIAKLSAYDFDRKSLMFILAYLKSRKQRTRIGLAFSDYLNILFGVLQGSILGPILFIILLSDFFYIYNDLDYASYADDTTLYVCTEKYAEAIEFLEPTINNIFA